jgi:hypothetical protein
MLVPVLTQWPPRYADKKPSMLVAFIPVHCLGSGLTIKLWDDVLSRLHEGRQLYERVSPLLDSCHLGICQCRRQYLG